MKANTKETKMSKKPINVLSWQKRYKETAMHRHSFSKLLGVGAGVLAAAVAVFMYLTLRQPVAISREILKFVAPAVAYHPRGFSPKAVDSKVSLKSIVSDLELLRDTGFRSIVTYSSQGFLGYIPKLARDAGFDGTVVMGLWDPWSDEEWHNAVEQAPNVDGYCLGNEGLGIRYEPAKLASRMDELRMLTGKPVTTSEHIDSYLNGSHQQWLLENSDWLFPIAHPFLAHQQELEQEISWITVRHDYLASTSGYPVILKEAGVPSGGSPNINEYSQVAFFGALEATGIHFFYFEAFDQPWKTNLIKGDAVEAHWGLFRADGTPKELVTWLTKRWAR